MYLAYQFFTLLADAAATTSPTPTEALPSYEGAFLKMLLTFAALIVGIIGAVWFLRRMAGGKFGGAAGRSIKIIEKKPLSPKTMLYIIEFEGKQTLITESQLEVKKLISLDLLNEVEKEET